MPTTLDDPSVETDASDGLSKDLTTLRGLQDQSAPATSTPAGPTQAPNYAAQFNTPLTPAQEQAFQTWKAKYAPTDDGSDYDLRGAFKAGLTPDPERGHFPDTFKKPNHPTFSDESVWSGKPDGKGGTFQGGHWGNDDSFTEGSTNKEFHSNASLQSYFSSVEPNSKLNLLPDAPPTWSQVQALPQFQNANAQQKQDAFTKWISTAHYYSAASGYNPNNSEKSQISEWTAKQARDLGMASFIDPNSGQSVPINTGQIADFGSRMEQAIGGTVGKAIQGISHASRYVDPTSWISSLTGLKSGQDDVEALGKRIESQAENVPTNPLDDKSIEAKTAGFLGPAIALASTGGGGAIAGGSGMMAQQFKEDASDAGLSPTRQELAFGVGGAVGAVTQKLAGIFPWLKEAGPEGVKEALTQTTSATLLKALSVNAIRGFGEGVGQTAGEQVALGQNPISLENLHQDLDAGLTFAIGNGFLGAGFKGLGVVGAKRALNAQWQAENADREADGRPPISLPDYTAQRIAESGPVTTPALPKPTDTPETPSNPAEDPLDAYNADLTKQVNAPVEGAEQETDIKGTHPVFGEGTYPPHAMLGKMGTTDISPDTQQLSWNDQPTAQVRRNDEQGNWTYDTATPEELASPTFQQPTLTKEDLINSKPPIEASTNPAELATARLVGPATTLEVVKSNEEENDTAKEQSSKPQPVLDQTGLGNGGRPRPDNGQQNVLDASSPDGQRVNARDNEVPVTEGGGSAEATALPPAPKGAPADTRAWINDQIAKRGITREQALSERAAAQAKRQAWLDSHPVGTVIKVGDKYYVKGHNGEWGDLRETTPLDPANPFKGNKSKNATPKTGNKKTTGSTLSTWEEGEEPEVVGHYGGNTVKGGKGKGSALVDLDPNDFTPIEEKGKPNAGTKTIAEPTAPAEPKSLEEGKSTPSANQPEAEPAPKEVEAPAALKSIVDSAMKRLGIKGVKVTYTNEGNRPALAHPLRANEIFINPRVFAEASDRLPTQEAKDEWLNRIVSEEVFHDAQHEVEAEWRDKGVHEQETDKIYQEISPKDRKATVARYGDDSIDPEKGTSPEDVARRKSLFIREHARMILDRKLRGETTEDTWLQGDKPALVRYFTALYNKLKARIAAGGNSHLSAYLRATEEVLNEAKKNGQAVPEKFDEAPGQRPSETIPPSEFTSASMPPLPAKAKAMLDTGDALRKELLADISPKYALDRTRAKRLLSAEQQRSSQQVKKIMTSFNKAVPDAIRRDAITIYREAGGDDATLKKWADGTKDPERKKAYEAARNLTPEEKTWADKISQTYDLTRKRLVQMGVDVSEISNYANHVWKEGAVQKLQRATSKNLKTAFQYAKQRKIPSYFEGEQLGLEPETKDAGKLLGGYILDANRVIASRNFIKNLSQGKEADGRPIVAPKFGGFTHLDKGADGKIHLVFNGKSPEEYDDYRDDLKIPALSNWAFKGKFGDTTILGRSDMAIHPNAHSDLKNIFGRSQIREWWDSPSDSVASQLVKSSAKFLLDDLNSYGKTTLFGGLPFFHAVQETMESASHLALPSKGSEYFHEPDLSDPAQMDKAEHGLMLAPDRASQALFEDGMDSAKRNLLVKLAKHIPGIGPKIEQAVQFGQDWLFESYIPSLKSKMYDVALARNQGRFAKELQSGKLTLDQVKYLTADQTNNAFGHLNYTDIARNPLMQHIMQMGILAPDFTEARIRHAGQALKGLAGSKGGREQTMAMVGMALAFYVTARVLNASLNNGDTKPDEPFSVVYGNRRYGVRFAGGDIMELFKNWRGWVGGRESPITRAGMELMTGVNYRGEQVSAGDAFKDALAGNMPMYLQPMLRDISPNTKNNPVGPLEQFMSGMGMKISRYSPISQVYPLAKDWIAKNGSDYGIKPDQGTYPTSQYTPLKYALDDADLNRAWTEYQKLVADNNGNAGKVANGLKKSVESNFTHNRQAEQAFYESLNPDDKKLYDAAVARREVLLDRFGAMFQQHDNGR